jgi:hypothetical protein
MSKIAELRQAFIAGAGFGAGYLSATGATLGAADCAKLRYPSVRQTRIIEIDTWQYAFFEGALYGDATGAPWHGHVGNGWIKLNQPVYHVSYINGELKAKKPVLHHLGPIAELIQNPTEMVDD